MSDDFGMMRRYFTSRLENFQCRPDLHREQIADCLHYLEMMDGAGSLEDFQVRVRQSGNMVSTARAEALDRYRNRAAVYRSLGQERKEAEDLERMELIRSAETHAQLSRLLCEFEEEPGEAYEENKAMNAVGSVFEALFHLCTDPPGSGARERSLIKFREYWKQMEQADPGISWERLTTYPAYRDRLVFNNRQLGILEGVFREVADGQHT
jgi:hypothetical protein